MLSHETAQAIVTRTMEILPYNINVMDERGIIIGSGDPNRIGSLHGGAQQIQRVADKLTISEQDNHVWQGVKPGVNMPIHFHGETIGTVGITGAPEEVTPFGQLVKMTAEMILEQTYLIEQIQFDERIQREFVFQWINEELTGNALKEKAESLAVDLHRPRRVLLLESQTPLDPASKRQDANRIEKMLKPQLQAHDLIAVFHDQVIIIKDCTHSDVTLTLSHWQRNILPASVHIAAGNQATEPREVPISFYQAGRTLSASSDECNEDTIHYYQDYMIDALLQYTTEDERCYRYFSLSELNHLLKDQPVLKKTLREFIAHNGFIGDTAAALFIHRNTLQYRLNKITEETGKDPRNLQDLLYLYAALKISSAKPRTT
ncbi:CdaR family transcriptional regulator [Salisediminibacterium halotolerans]|uniref:CdaR family transcriptional regulator n=1 Tax=Salisediminibacterium halotolerans TaxID=517425 RepID=UPI000EB5361D|nr:sugar diacid recognition domain-containing protein [Salisediminibacterium halotolerans]RLJ75671.1 CdaR family transcriptional regulator [Actinophytocola xinjiangensis]RPE89525.1 CdaR family transcriptional regulator [Salisediminibacterium halotolerans]TWG36284.1 CdaR family transcriptional regulator [Salisediminibacterium halotolerans]GEL07368.1 CdaR family transcriptional regulator [Salisediminibacterium halotolerans]